MILLYILWTAGLSVFVQITCWLSSACSVLLIQAATKHLFVTFISHLKTMNAVAYKQLLWSAKARIYTRKNFLQK